MSSFPNLRHLRAVLEVARRGSVSAAARALHLSQPGVTQAVAAIERELGAALFVRTPRGLASTSAGALFVARTQRALNHLQEGIAEIVRSRTGATPLQGITAAQLATLMAIVEQGGMGRAARAEGRARATIHRAARQLEAAIDVVLFETTSHGVRPTREGERLARRVHLAASELRQARAEVAALAGVERGMTVIGAMPLARSAIVPHAVLTFAAAFPSHTVSILDGPYESMLAELQRGRADLLIGALRGAPPTDVEQEQLADDALAIIVRSGHPLVAATRGRAPRRDELARHAWIAPRRGSPLRVHFDRLFVEHTTRPMAAAVECNSVVAARAMLLASDRAMLLSAHQVRDDLRAGALVALPHPDGRVVRSIGLTVRRDWRPTTAQAALLETIRAVARRLDDQADIVVSKPSRTRKARGDTPIRRVKNRVK